MTSIFKESIIDRILYNTDETYSFIDLAFDWLSDNMYYIQIPKNHSNGQYQIWVKKINNNTIESKNVFANTHDDAVCPGSLIIAVYEGYIFFTDCDYSSKKQKINKVRLDGSNLSMVYEFSSEKEMKTIAMDSDENKIYFLNNYENLISYTDFDFFNSASLQSTVEIEKIKSMYVHKKNLYVCDSFNIWRFDKYNGTDATKVIPTFRNASKKIISGFKIVSTAQIFKKADNFCSKNNGGCDEYCFSRPQKYCGCGYGKKLENDRHCTPIA